MVMVGFGGLAAFSVLMLWFVWRVAYCLRRVLCADLICGVVDLVG